jgi:Secretion system C-terminal sorting domain/PKD-like domain
MKTRILSSFVFVLCFLSLSQFANAQCPGISGTWSFCRNENNTLTFTLSNPPASAYTWSVPYGNIISGQGTPTLVVNFPIACAPANVPFNITVSWGVNAGCGLNTSHQTYASVFTPAPLIGPTSVCANTANWVYSAMGNAGPGPTPALDYLFYVTGGTITQQWGIPINTYDFNYFIRVDWGSGSVGKIKWCIRNFQPGYNICSFCDSVNINLLGTNPIPTVNLGPDINACVFPVTLNAGSGHLAYSWNTNATTQTISAPGVNAYSVTVLDAGGCSSDDINVFSGSPLNVTITPTSSSLPMCPGTPIALNAGTGPGWTYLWNNGVTTQVNNVSTPAFYAVTVTAPGGCTGTDNQLVEYIPGPVISPASPTLCPAGSVTLDAGSGFISYLWSNGATTQTTSVSSTGTYFVTVVTPSGCARTGSRIVALGTAAPISISSPTSGILCTGSTGGGTVTLTASNGYSNYLWSNGATTQSITVLITGTYTVSASNGGPCVSTASQVVTAVCGTPAGRFTTNLLSNSVTFNWGAVPCANKYRIYYKPVSSPLWLQVVVNAPATSVNVAGLGNQTAYQWRMQSICPGMGNSVFSSTLTFSTPFKTDDPGVADVPVNTGLELFPNPNEGKFTLRYYHESGGEVEICMYDMQGKLILCETRNAEAGENSWVIDAGELPTGIYLVRAGSNYLRFLVE